MCTVSYVPLGLDQFILTSNRDENPDRITLQPGEEITIVQSETMPTGQADIICPKDSKAGGSWIAMSTNGKVACLLNGAFKKHVHEPSYRKSRGLILMEYFSFSNAIEFHNKIDLRGIENFTLIMLEEDSGYELRWNGEEKFFKFILKNEAQLWSSCTLYDEETALQKEIKFNNWIETKEKPTVGELSFFHGLNNPDGFLLPARLFGSDEKKQMVKTVSITSVQKRDSSISMHYYDLLTKTSVEKQVEL